jgi:hypothetical protein
MVWESVVGYQLITASAAESAVTATEVNQASSHRKIYYGVKLLFFVK